MIVGLSGVRADVIPWGLVQGPLADLLGFNVVGMRRRGVTKTEIMNLRQAYQVLFFGEGAFRNRVDVVAAQFAQDTRVQAMIAFIRAGKRPLTMAVHRAEAGDEA